MTYSLALPLRAGLLLLTLVGTAAALLTRQPIYWLPGLALIIGQIAELVRYLNRQNRELTDFLDSLRYHDFSTNLNAANAPASVRQARQLLNDINRTFARLTQEKEAQHLYLQNVLALVNTGILSYEETSQDVRWMNESLKRLLQIPYVKTLDGLKKRNEPLYQALTTLRPGENRVVRINGRAVLLSATAFTEAESRSRLVAFQPVEEALDENEAQAYQKILRVLTHEIMNSVAPIVSLADTLQQRLQAKNASIDDVEAGIGVMKKRSEGLLQFAQTYRNLSKLSAASFQPVGVLNLFEGVLTLLDPTFAQRGIEPDVILPDIDLTIQADPVLIEQVLINLLTNALDALRNVDQPELRLSGFRQDDGRAVMQVADNGQGIPEAMLEDIFVPFFTTKKHGSGIGLSLSRQIMHLHRGHIQVESTKGRGSLFTLTFPG
ncbi:sensor histidine kinase [Spirosoma soli]|uniref:histidine kinase n=1 Tax=Spirosoma soli TaxID=1770529 RepID=A0ABW5M9I3_9BACT